MHSNLPYVQYTAIYPVPYYCHTCPSLLPSSIMTSFCCWIFLTSNLLLLNLGHELFYLLSRHRTCSFTLGFFGKFNVIQANNTQKLHILIIIRNIKTREWQRKVYLRSYYFEWNRSMSSSLIKWSTVNSMHSVTALLLHLHLEYLPLHCLYFSTSAVHDESLTRQQGNFFSWHNLYIKGAAWIT